MPNRYKIPTEGDLYMKLSLYGHTFELRYGFYEEADREYGEPVVIYPDFSNNPIFTKDGYPLVTAIQAPCEHYTVHEGSAPEECCSDCIHYKNGKNEIDICLCEERRKTENAILTKAGGNT